MCVWVIVWHCAQTCIFSSHSRLPPGPVWIRWINYRLERPVMSHHVCISLQLSWKTTVDDGTPCIQSIKPAALTHNWPVIIVHIITASHSVCHTDNWIGGYWQGYYILEDFSHLVRRSAFIVRGLPVAPTRGYTVYSCYLEKPDQRMEENPLMWENVSFFQGKTNSLAWTSK